MEEEEEEKRGGGRARKVKSVKVGPSLPAQAGMITSARPSVVRHVSHCYLNKVSRSPANEIIYQYRALPVLIWQANARTLMEDNNASGRMQDICQIVQLAHT